NLRSIADVFIGDEQWRSYEFPLASGLPLGYHTIALTLDDHMLARSNLIVCPDRAYIPEHLAQGGRTAGFNVALYGLRSNRNWGCGDFTDLYGLVEWARREVGFSFIGVNPLHALHNRAPYNTSPYLPLSMFYKNWIYMDIEAVPEFRASSCAQGLLQSVSVREKIRRLREAEFVAYQEVDRMKRRFLKLLFREFSRTRATNTERTAQFRRFCEEEGALLDKFALYCALDEVLHREDRNRWTWQQWPAEYHDPESEACTAFRKRHPRTIEFYKYIQFVIEEQLSTAQAFAKRAGMAIGLYHDLAVATDSCGSDLWAHRELYVNGCRVGAPPDDFSPNGQDWAFPPPNTLAHRDDGYRLYRESIRKIMRHGGALRIDHVMRLFRLFWIPEGESAARGTYVRDNALDLLRILALESVRAKSIVIGEDLGTVTDEMREALARFGILSYRLFYFEKHDHDKSFRRTHEYPRQALVSSTTHDLPTIAGFWTFRDIEARRAAGLVDEAGYRTQMEDRKREKQRMLDMLHAENLVPHQFPRDAAQIHEIDGDLHNAMIGFLAQVASMILLLNQEDLTKETEQQNLPGSTAQYPNWQRKMKVKIEELDSPALGPYAAMFRDQLARCGRKT
ncbi:MAG: 4-alpha-glucanotransferase, partial [Acidobacteriaceae bacterium]|nr:4-alpha-glucanotransferase [Acidobacteriaceae bacterium]